MWVCDISELKTSSLKDQNNQVHPTHFPEALGFAFFCRSFCADRHIHRFTAAGVSVKAGNDMFTSDFDGVALPCDKFSHPGS